jgi:hypothetical protein
MSSNDFINNLLEALANKKIKQEIVKIIDEKNDRFKIFSKNTYEEKDEQLESDNKVLELKDIVKKEKNEKEQLSKSISNLENTINDLKKQLESRNDIIINLKNENSNLNKKYIDGQQKLEYEKNETAKINKIYQLIYGEAKQLKENLAYYENTYKSLNSCYETFKSLKSEIHSELANVIKTENSEIFLCAGVQWDNIEALWSFISYKLSEYDENEIKILTDTFNYFFEKYNEIHRLYTLLVVNINDEFDEDLHTRASNSCVTGKISKVLLKGYKNIRTNKIVQKSIVRV